MCRRGRCSYCGPRLPSEGGLDAEIPNGGRETEGVVGPIVLGEAGAATDAAGEVGQSDVCKPAVGFCCAVAEGNAVVRLAICRARTIGSLELLIKAVIAKSECIDNGRTRHKVPLHSRKMNPRIVAWPPVGLGDGLIVHNQS